MAHFYSEYDFREGCQNVSHTRELKIEVFGISRGMIRDTIFWNSFAY